MQRIKDQTKEKEDEKKEEEQAGKDSSVSPGILPEDYNRPTS